MNIRVTQAVREVGKNLLRIPCPWCLKDHTCINSENEIPFHVDQIEILTFYILLCTVIVGTSLSVLNNNNAELQLYIYIM